MTTKRTNINQGGEEDEGQQTEHSRPYRGIGRRHRGCQEKAGRKRQFGQGRGIEKADGETGTCYTVLQWQCPGNVNDIFGSKETIEEYKQSIGDEAVASLRLYTEANEKDMRKHGVPTIKELLNKILEMLTAHVEKDKQTSEQVRQKQSVISELWQIIRSDKAINAIRLLWSKVPDGWHKNPYVWTGMGCTLVFFVLFAVSWVQWHEYREENRRLRTVADKHHVTTVMLNELYPELAVTVGAYEKLVDVVGVDSTLAIFNRQVKTVREEEKQSKQQK